MSKYSERSRLHHGVVKPWVMIHGRDDKTVQRFIGQVMKDEYSEVPNQALPPRLQELLDELDRATATQNVYCAKRQ